MALCSSCRHALSTLHPYHASRQLRITLTLERYDDATTRTRCWVCHKLSGWLEREHAEVYKTWKKTSLVITYYRESRQLHFPASFDTGSLESRIYQVEVSPLLPDGGELKDSLSVMCFLMPAADYHNVASSTLESHQRREESTLDLPLIRSWIQRCTATHDRCNQRKNTSWYPTRLLKLDNGGRAMRLIMTKDHDTLGPYMTLSHRWGHVEYRRLTSATSREFQTAIDTAALPAAFQEAAVVADALGVGYIWIDSLCIEQDGDLEDWKREAPKMRHVYGHSFLNLAATLSPSTGTTSLFSTDTRHPHMPTPFEANTITRPDVPLSLSEAKVAASGEGIDPSDVVPKQYYLMDGDMWEHEVEQSPLKSRGWVFQECLLATRILHFGQRQLAWECQQGFPSLELFPGGLPAGLPPNPAPNSFSAALSSRVSDASHEDFRRAWHHLVNIYSQCGLTKLKDKLVALAGVAGRIEDARQDQYMAGLWKSTLVSDLAWTTFSGLARSRYQTAFRAPSWSWLSLDGEVSFAHDKTVAGYYAVVQTYPEQSDVGCSALVAKGKIGIAAILLPLESIAHAGSAIDSFSIAGMEFVDGWTEQESHLDLVVPGSEYQHLVQQGMYVMPLYYSKTTIYSMVVAGSGRVGDEHRRVGAMQIQVARYEDTSSPAAPGWTVRDGVIEATEGNYCRCHVNTKAMKLSLVINLMLSRAGRQVITLA